MNALLNYALNTKAIVVDNLIKVLDSLDYKKEIDVDHVVAYILGLTDPYKDDFPQIAELPDGVGLANFKRYDVLLDEVLFEFDETDVLYFKSASDAEKYSQGENYYNLDYKYSEREDYPYKGERICKRLGHCPRAVWLLNAKM